MSCLYFAHIRPGPENEAALRIVIRESRQSMCSFFPPGYKTENDNQRICNDQIKDS
jgi:hypothetical protein